MIEGNILPTPCFESEMLAFAMSWASASRGMPCGPFVDTELAVLEVVIEGTEDELPIEEPERDVVTDAFPFGKCGCCCSER